MERSDRVTADPGQQSGQRANQDEVLIEDRAVSGDHRHRERNQAAGQAGVESSSVSLDAGVAPDRRRVSAARSDVPSRPSQAKQTDQTELGANIEEGAVCAEGHARRQDPEVTRVVAEER